MAMEGDQSLKLRLQPQQHGEGGEGGMKNAGQSDRGQTRWQSSPFPFHFPSHHLPPRGGQASMFVPFPPPNLASPCSGVWRESLQLILIFST